MLSVGAYGGVVGNFGVLVFCVRFVSCILMMSGRVLCTRWVVVLSVLGVVTFCVGV